MNNTKRIYIPFTKAAVDGDEQIVSGYATTEAVDHDGEIVTREAMDATWDQYIKFGNIREQHDPHKAAGVVVDWKADEVGYFITAKVVDADAWEKVKAGVYKGFSIGGEVLSRAGNKITELFLAEISLVDRPNNPEAVYTMVKTTQGAHMQKGLMEVASFSYIMDNLHALEERVEAMQSMGQPVDPKVKDALETLVIQMADTLTLLTADAVANAKAEEKQPEAPAPAPVPELETKEEAIVSTLKKAFTAFKKDEAAGIHAAASEVLTHAAACKEEAAGEESHSALHRACEAMCAAIHEAIGDAPAPEAPKEEPKAPEGDSPKPKADEEQAKKDEAAKEETRKEDAMKVSSLEKTVAALTEKVAALSAPKPIAGIPLMVVGKDGQAEPIEKALAPSKDDSAQELIKKAQLAARLGIVIEGLKQ